MKKMCVYWIEYSYFITKNKVTFWIQNFVVKMENISLLAHMIGTWLTGGLTCSKKLWDHRKTRQNIFWNISKNWTIYKKIYTIVIQCLKLLYPPFLHMSSTKKEWNQFSAIYKSQTQQPSLWIILVSSERGSD